MKLSSNCANESFQGAIFDCDGTLIDSLDAWRTLEGSLAKRAGVTVTPEERELFATFTIPEVAHYFHVNFGLGSSSVEVEGMVDEHMLSFYSSSAKPLPGVVAFLEECARAGIRMSVASSSRPSYLEAGLSCAGIREYFAAVVSVDDVGASKREPAVFERAFDVLGVPRAATWGFEDSLYALDTLTKAGFKTVGVYDPAEGVTFEELQRRSTLAVKSFEDLNVGLLA